MPRSRIYLIAGHGTDDMKYVEKAIAECRIKKPSVGYIGTAGGDNPVGFVRMENTLKDCGAGKVTLAPLAPRHADEDEAYRVLSECDVVFIGGGEVEDGMKALTGRIRKLLWEKYESGTTFIGISAGTIMMGLAWPHWDDEDNDFDNAYLFDCLGFVPTVFDTHCEDEGWPELKKAVSLSAEGFTGYGIRAGEMVFGMPDGSITPVSATNPYTRINGEAVGLSK